MFLDAIQGTWPEAERAGIEINPNLARLAEDNGHEVHNYNALLYPLKSGGPDGKWDAIITNPPFIHAEDWITTFLPRLAPDGIMALLLRLNFLGSQGRWERLWQHEAYRPSHMYVMPARVGFTTDGGTDSIEYMIAVWRPDPPEAMTWSFLNNLDTEFRWTEPHAKYHPEAPP